MDEVIVTGTLDEILDRVMKLQDEYYSIPVGGLKWTEKEYIKQHWNETKE